MPPEFNELPIPDQNEDAKQKDVNNSRCVNLINNDFEVVKSLSIGDVSYTIAKKR